MNNKQWTKALYRYFQGLLIKEDRFFEIAPGRRELVLDILKWHKVEQIACEFYLSGSSGHNPEYDIAFKDQRIEHLLKDEMILRQLTEIEGIFRKADIPFIVLKGQVWAEPIYNSPVLRHIGDLDLLVKPAYKDDALKKLLNLGYHPQPIGKSLEDDLNLRGEVMLIFKEDFTSLKSSVELHWELLPAPRFMKHMRIPVEDMFASSHEFTYRNLSLLLPQPEMRFAFNVIHGVCQHQFKRFLPLLDLAHLIDKYDGFDYQLLMEIFRKWKVVHSLYFALKYLELFDYKKEALVEIRKKIEGKAPFQIKSLASVISAERMLLSYKGKNFYIRKLMRLLSSQPFSF
jgi:hypothetical protein